MVDINGVEHVPDKSLCDIVAENLTDHVRVCVHCHVAWPCDPAVRALYNALIEV